MLKIKKIMWQAIPDRLPAADQTRMRNGPGSAFYEICGAREDTNHVLFNCVFAKLLWSCVRSWLNVSWSPSSFADLRSSSSELSQQKKAPVFGWILCHELGAMDYGEQVYYRICLS